MQYDSVELRLGIDWDFRPGTYFPPGRPRRPERIPDALREALGRMHPSLMGGLYLPDFLPKEVEIARIELESVTADVISVRARPVGKRIAYRIVDEYGTHYPVAPATSARPLTFDALARLIDFSGPDPGGQGGVVLGTVMYNVIDGGCDPRDFYSFAKVTSKFYPEIGRWYERLVGEWLDERVAAWDAAHRDEENGHAPAP